MYIKLIGNYISLRGTQNSYIICVTGLKCYSVYILCYKRYATDAYAKLAIIISYTIAAKPIKTLELCYPMSQLLIKVFRNVKAWFTRTTQA